MGEAWGKAWGKGIKRCRRISATGADTILKAEHIRTKRGYKRVNRSFAGKETLKTRQINRRILTMILLLLNLLILVPIAAWIITKRHWRSHRWLITGASFGVVVSSLSMGLYATFFLSPFGLITGMVGLMSVLFHGVLGYKVAIYFGLVPAATVVEGIYHLYIDGINAIIWAIVYGGSGWVIDWLLSRRREHARLG